MAVGQMQDVFLHGIGLPEVEIMMLYQADGRCPVGNAGKLKRQVIAGKPVDCGEFDIAGKPISPSGLASENRTAFSRLSMSMSQI